MTSSASRSPSTACSSSPTSWTSSEFPTALGIRPNIPQPELRDIVWEQVTRDLTAQGVLDVFGEPHPEVAAMVDTLSRSDRTLEGRWWRRDVGGKMVRFVVCRKGDRHVVAARDGDMLVLQRVAPQIGLAGMVNTVLGPRNAADVEPLTGVASKLAECRDCQTAREVRRRADFGACVRRHHRRTRRAGWRSPPSNAIPAARSPRPTSRPGCSTPGRAASCRFRAGSTASCTAASCRAARRTSSARSTDLIEFLPSGRWFDQTSTDAAEANGTELQ